MLLIYLCNIHVSCSLLNACRSMLYVAPTMADEDGVVNMADPNMHGETTLVRKVGVSLMIQSSGKDLIPLLSLTL